MLHVPVLLQAEALGAALVLLLLAFFAAAIIAFVLVAVWLYNDSKQRGESTALWLTLYIVVGLVTTPLGSVIVLVIYLVTRSPDIKYDKQGNLLVPAAPVAPAYFGQPQQGWQPVPVPLPGYAQPAPPGYGQAPPPHAPLPRTAPPGPAPQGWAPPVLSKVRCPRCRTIFEYQKQLVGQTHVKCPACGEEGNI